MVGAGWAKLYFEQTDQPWENVRVVSLRRGKPIAEMEAEGFLVEDNWQAEPGTNAASPSVQLHPSGGIADLWEGAFSDQSLPIPAVVQGVSSNSQGRVVSFEELAQLVRRPRPRRRPVPSEQLALFSGLGR